MRKTLKVRFPDASVYAAKLTKYEVQLWYLETLQIAQVRVFLETIPLDCTRIILYIKTFFLFFVSLSELIEELS